MIATSYSAVPGRVSRHLSTSHYYYYYYYYYYYCLAASRVTSRPAASAASIRSCPCRSTVANCAWGWV